MSLSSIRARVEAATPGPWEKVQYDGWWIGGKAYMQMATEAWPYEPDVDFIAHARTDIPLLLKVAEAAEEQVMWEGQICPWFPGLKHEDCERCGNAVLCAALAELEAAE